MKTIQVMGVVVHTDILSAKFACDYGVCKGACCYVDIPDCDGCVVTKNEAEIIEKNREVLSHLCNREIPRKLTYTDDYGNYYVAMHKDGKCCLNSDDGCVLSKAKCMGLLEYGKPISCHLYPLILEEYKRVHLKLGHYYDDLHLCDAGFRKGECTGTYLIEFCREAIERRFGSNFYKKLIQRAQKFR